MAEIPPYDPNPGAYVYDEVARHIALRIEAGRGESRPADALPPGARLAGERDLAEEYGVAVETARRAVRALREQGLVYTLPAKGTFVVAREPEAEK
ncbi:DNA-binding GntR family transcriptional regulator [Nocardiopsis mwathae]|uniref:DNA-binding GntR family transcriptional regulator n=1 Tax=Nocardiopsis mwathae TaxID=1472723 RepID=A0A7W9YJN1_9ACTN|nr:winged helix-turn-helix domain-containing protein [Nocardiopsis mwathae]MBB6173368.1 DNA-binding GntR family transcriptional regulator [Nocardiopsis mwathae]